MEIHRQNSSFSQFKWIMWISIFLVISVLVFFKFFSNKLVDTYKTEWINKSNKDNLFISCQDNSDSLDNPSLKVIIDSTEIINIDHMDQLKGAKSYKLEQGKYILKISTCENKYLLIDTIEIENSLIDYRLFVIYSDDSMDITNNNKKAYFDFTFHNLLKE